MSVVSVLGGGISGLSAAHYLVRKNVARVNLYEASDRFGGWIKTQKNEKEGFLFESGPRTIRPKGDQGNLTLQMIEDLGLEKKVLPIKSDHVAAKNRMIYVGKKLCLLPSDVGGIFKTLPPFTKPLVFAGLKDLFTGKSKKKLDDESIYDFTKRRFGSEIADYAISAMICGICAGNAKEISVKFLMKDIFATEQKYGGVLRGLLIDNFKNKKIQNKIKYSNLFNRSKLEKWSIYTLDGGLEILPQQLVKNLTENDKVSLDLNAKCQEVHFESNKNIKIRINDQLHDSKHLISSIPSEQLSQLVSKQHPKLANELQEIKNVNVAVINLHYRSDDLLKYQGFGLLVPPIENLPILGIIFDSSCLDMKDHTVLTVMMGGAWFEKRFGDNPTEQHLLDVALKSIKDILNIEQTPDNYKVNILNKCIPQYILGHHQRVERIRDYIKDHKLPLNLCGASYDGVGVNDVILSAQTAVNKIL